MPWFCVDRVKCIVLYCGMMYVDKGREKDALTVRGERHTHREKRRERGREGAGEGG